MDAIEYSSMYALSCGVIHRMPGCPKMCALGAHRMPYILMLVYKAGIARDLNGEWNDYTTRLFESFGLFDAAPRPIRHNVSGRFGRRCGASGVPTSAAGH